MAYLDDLLIYSLTYEEHLKHLDITFNILREVGLRVKQKKCTFANASCGYLGYIVGSGEIKPIESKMSAIRNFIWPITKKDVRSFLGMCGYY